MHWIRKKEENAHLYKEMLLIQGGLESLTITASFIFKAKKSPCFFTLNDLRASNQKITTLFSVMTSVGHAGHGIALLFDNLLLLRGESYFTCWRWVVLFGMFFLFFYGICKTSLSINLVITHHHNKLPIAQLWMVTLKKEFFNKLR